MEVIAGLGMAGLGAALAAERAGAEWLAVDRAAAPGGWARTQRQGRYRLDHGPHIMLDFDATLRDWLELEAALPLRQHQSQSVFFCDVAGQPHAVPLPLAENLHALPPHDPLPPLPCAAQDGGGHYASYLEQSFGAEIARRFLQPYDAKRLCADLTALPPKWNKRVLPARKAKLGEAVFHYPQSAGVGALPDLLARRLPARRMRLRCGLERVSLARRRVWLTDGSEIAFDRLYSSVPLPQFLSLLDRPIATAAQVAAALPSAATRISYLGLSQGWAQPYTFARFATRAVPFHRLTALSAYAPGCCPPGEGLVMVETNLPRGAAGPYDTAAALRADLDRLGLLPPEARTTFFHQTTVPHSTVYATHQTAAFLEDIHATLAQSGVTLIGKYGRWEDMLMGRALMSGRAAMQARGPAPVAAEGAS